MCRFVNLFGKFSPAAIAAVLTALDAALVAAAAAATATAAADKLTTSVQVVKEHKKVNVDNVSS